jgi:uncharacterized protein YndB with AHSA1/START domain
MNTSIRQEFFYAHPAERVWDYLTKPELISQWLMENDFQLISGHEFQFRTKPYPALDFDGICYCKILEIVPYKKLSYTWKVGPNPGTVSLDSVVVWTLTEKENGTTVLLEHSGFKEHNLKLFTGMTDGWLKNMQKIADRLNAVVHGTVNT